jgi:hypothetical protein
MIETIPQAHRPILISLKSRKLSLVAAECHTLRRAARSRTSLRQGSDDEPNFRRRSSAGVLKSPMNEGLSSRSTAMCCSRL